MHINACERERKMQLAVVTRPGMDTFLHQLLLSGASFSQGK